MDKTLITGASGFIGSALARAMAPDHDILCLSRARYKPDVDAPYARGKFHSFEDLRRLDRYKFDVAIHLAAVTGGCLESDCMMINVEGTRRLLRYLIDRGCRKFVLASSIAVIGMQSKEFRPLQLPVPDEHPCLDRDGYGFSKYLMEEVTRYYARQNPDLDFINIRLASIEEDTAVLTPRKAGPLIEWAFGEVSFMLLSDAVRVFTLAAEAPHKPGVRIMNAVGKQACVEDTVPEVIRAWYPDIADGIDLSYYERPGHERDALFDIRRVREELGFEPECDILATSPGPE